VGQGFGINPDIGGMRIYETMRARQPDFFIQSGDTIDADGPVLAQQTCDSDELWRNVVRSRRHSPSFAGTTATTFSTRSCGASMRRYRRSGKWDDHELIDLRGYPAANSDNRQAKPSAQTELLGPAQLRWLERELAQSHANLEGDRVRHALGLLVRDGRDSGVRTITRRAVRGTRLRVLIR
jgi:alkaline phosphatase D